MLTKLISTKYLSKAIQKKYWSHKKNARPYNHLIVELFANQRIDFLKQHINFKKIKSAFDVGCGDGFSTYYMDQVIPNVQGGDASKLMLDNNPLPKKKLHLIDAEKIKFPDNSYDLVYTWEVLHHLSNPSASIKEMARISKKYVVIFEPNGYNLLQFGFGLVNPYERGNLSSTKYNLEQLCLKHNLKIIASTYCGHIFPNVTPVPIAKLLAKLPFKADPITGISIVIIAEK